MVSLFDYSGVMCEPWAEAGYTCLALDIQHPLIISHASVMEDMAQGIRKIHWNALSDFSYMILPEEISFIAAFPPCDDLAVSGARWFKDKGLKSLIDALRLVESARHICEDRYDAPFFIENPVSTLSTYWRKPDYRFDPCDYAGYLDEPSTDAYTKKTCLWTGNGFVMPDPKKVEPVQVCAQGSWVQKLGGKSKKTKNLRSKTPEGFAKAVFLANHKENNNND
jgi:hypothetical protein